MTSLLAVIPKSVPEAKRALAIMERDVESAKTYDAIRRYERAAEAFKILFAGVRDIRESSERIIAIAQHRIAAELAKVPKATRAGPGRGKAISQPREIVSGRAATGLPKDKRSRLGKLGKASLLKIKEVVAQLHSEGKEASEAAILRELKTEEIKEKRTNYESRRDRGARIADLVAMAENGERFNVIYADPPWEFKVYSGKGKQRSAERYYDTSSLSAIKALPVARLSAKDCALFLWGVWPELPGALEVIKAWGFEYKTAGFVWVKQVSDNNPALFTGMGYWTRANSEPCLFATKGSPERMAMDVHQVVLSPVREHSKKPDEVRRRIERLMLGPYLELFGRRSIPGWTVWGNEIEQSEAA